MEERTGRTNQRKLMVQDKDTLITEGQKKSKGSKSSHSQLPQADQRPASLRAMVTLEDQTLSFYC